MKYKKYPTYKDSGVEWLEKIPEHWNIQKLKWCISRNDGGVWGDDPINRKDTFVLRSTEQTVDGNWKINNPAKRHLSVNDIKTALLKKNDLLVTKSSGSSLHIGKTSLVDTNIEDLKCCYSNFMQRIRLNNTLLPKLAWYLMNNRLIRTQFDYLSNSTTGLANLNGTMMGQVILSIPNITEQQQIANFLDNATQKIDTLITKQDKLIELLKEKRQAVISHAVTNGINAQSSKWKNYRLDWTTLIVRGNTGFKKDELLNIGKYVALQYGKTYKVDEVNETFTFYVNDEFYKSDQVVHYGNTILISTSETIKDLGHSCFYHRTDLGLIGGEQILLKPNNGIMFDKYLYYSSKVFCGKLKKYATGSKVFRFNTDHLKKVFIAIPLLQEQQQIANYLDDKTTKIDTLIDKSKQSISLLKEKRTALISAAVTGKIDVRDIV